MGKIIYASPNEEPANEIIERAGVTTQKAPNGDVFWTYNGQTFKRPDVRNWEGVMKELFDIEIRYCNKPRK